MFVDHLCRPVGILGVDLRRHQHRGVAECARVEDRRHLADDALVEQPLNASHHLGFGHVRLRGDVLVGTNGDREAPLHQVEQPAVEVVERDRRAVLAAAGLCDRRGRPLRVARLHLGLRLDYVCSASHRAASFRVVGDDRVSACAMQGGEDLEHRRTLVQIAGGTRRLDHRVLAADVVGRDRQSNGGLDGGDHVADRPAPA